MRHLNRSPVGRALVFAAGIIILATSCARGQKQQPPASEASATQQDLIVQVASYDLAVGEETRVIVGLLTPDQEFVTHGTVALRLAFLGTKDETAQTPKYGSPLEGVFLAIPGETVEALAEGPVAGPASKGRGVYAVRAKFDRPGFWRAEVTADIRGDRKRTGVGSFEVLEDHKVPAPGDEALRTENHTLASKDVPGDAIDSRAGSGEIPDPELHNTTIAQAIEQKRPALVVFSTPTYCMSRFCGPVTDMVQELARDYPDRAAFIHIEIWRNFKNQEINKAAADWLFRDGDLREPWVFLIGADGRIGARWDNVATRGEIEPLLNQLPPL